jgi:hypothetical protein
MSNVNIAAAVFGTVLLIGCGIIINSQLSVRGLSINRFVRAVDECNIDKPLTYTKTIEGRGMRYVFECEVKSP